VNILITGGSGRLAKYVCQEFAEYDLMLADLVPPPDDRAHLPFTQTDVTSIEDCRAVMAACQPEAIVALGAIPNPTDDAKRRAAAEAAGRPMGPFDTTMKVNMMGLYNLLTAAAEAGVKTIIQTSSIVTVVTFGLPIHYLPVDERHPGFAVNSYNYSKIAGELMLKWFSKTHGMQTLMPRPAMNWSPERCQEHAASIQPATAWDPILWHYADTRDVALAHRQMFEARDRLPQHDMFLIHAADHRAMEDSRELVAKFRPDLLDTIPVYLRGRQSFTSCAKAHNAFGFQARYSWTDWL